MFWMCIRIASVILWRNTENYPFLPFDSDPRFPQFLLYVRWKSGVTFVRRCFRDVMQRHVNVRYKTDMSLAEQYSTYTEANKKGIGVLFLPIYFLWVY